MIHHLNPYFLHSLHYFHLRTLPHRLSFFQFRQENVVLSPQFLLSLTVLLVPYLQSLHSIPEREYLSIELIYLPNIGLTLFLQFHLESLSEFLVERIEIHVLCCF